MSTFVSAFELLSELRKALPNLNAEDLLLVLAGYADLQTIYWTTPTAPNQQKPPPLFADFVNDVRMQLSAAAPAPSVAPTPSVKPPAMSIAPKPAAKPAAKAVTPAAKKVVTAPESLPEDLVMGEMHTVVSLPTQLAANWLAQQVDLVGILDPWSPNDQEFLKWAAHVGKPLEELASTDDLTNRFWGMKIWRFPEGLWQDPKLPLALRVRLLTSTTHFYCEFCVVSLPSPTTCVVLQRLPPHNQPICDTVVTLAKPCRLRIVLTIQPSDADDESE